MMHTSPGDDRRPARPWVTAVVTLGLVGVVAATLLLTWRPDLGASPLVAVIANVMMLTIIVGPNVRGVRPRHAWLAQTVGAVFLFVGALYKWLPPLPGPLGFYDVCYFAGYGCLILWMVLLYRHVGRPAHSPTALDVTAVAGGVALLMWCIALAPMAHGSMLPDGLVQAVYPLVDATLLTMIVHLTYRVRVVSTSHRWLIGALSYQLVLDMAFMAHNLLLGRAYASFFQVGYLPTYYALAVVACHPSVVELSTPLVRDVGRRPGGRATAHLVLTASPAVLAVVMPMHGALDVAVRATLISLLLALLFIRMSGTVTALTLAETDSHHRATHDQLTGLLNRAALLSAVRGLLMNNAAQSRSTAVFFLDCDDFKHVNDTWGHHAGDRLLREVAQRLRGCLSPDDVLARQGGDEFVVATTVRDDDSARHLAERIRAAFDQPLNVLADRFHDVTPSIGVAICRPGDDLSTDELLRRADLAMYEAKGAGRGRVVVFDDALNRRSHRVASVSDRIDEAIRSEAFELQLQPIFSGPGYRHLVGWEALARWHHPDLGHVPPDLFIQVAEQHGQIDELGRLVLRRACRELAQLRREMGRYDLVVTVNVSPAQLTSPSFAAFVDAAMRAAELPEGSVWLEVTETLLLDDGPEVADTLERLRAVGARLCVDDFGTGYASLTRLLRMPVDCVKLDRSLVAWMDDGPDGAARLTSVIHMLRALGIPQIIAEGVETPAQGAALQRVGCPMVQGWLYGPPATTASAVG